MNNFKASAMRTKSRLSSMSSKISMTRDLRGLRDLLSKTFTISMAKDFTTPRWGNKIKLKRGGPQSRRVWLVEPNVLQTVMWVWRPKNPRAYNSATYSSISIDCIPNVNIKLRKQVNNTFAYVLLFFVFVIVCLLFALPLVNGSSCFCQSCVLAVCIYTVCLPVLLSCFTHSVCVGFRSLNVFFSFLL